MTRTPSRGMRGSMRGSVRAGFTLTELLVSMTLLSVVMGSVVSVVTHVQADYARQRSRDASMIAVRSAELLLDRVFRGAGADPNGIGVVGIVAQPNGAGSVRVRADFNPADGDVTDPLEDVIVDRSGRDMRVQWQAGGTMTPLVTPVSGLMFEYYRRDGTQITNLANADSAKRVRIVISSPVTDRFGNVTTLRSESWAFVRND